MAWVHIEDEYGGTWYEYHHTYSIENGWVILDGEKRAELISYKFKKRRQNTIKGLLLSSIVLITLIFIITLTLDILGYF